MEGAPQAQVEKAPPSKMEQAAPAQRKRAAPAKTKQAVPAKTESAAPAPVEEVAPAKFFKRVRHLLDVVAAVEAVVEHLRHEVRVRGDGLLDQLQERDGLRHPHEQP